MYQRQNNNSHPAQPHALLKGFPTIVGITRGRAEEQGFAFRNAIGGWKLQHARLFLRCSSCIIVGLKLLSPVNQEIPFPGSFLGSLFNLIATVSQCTDVTVWVIVFCRRISRSCRPYATKIKLQLFSLPLHYSKSCLFSGKSGKQAREFPFLSQTLKPHEFLLDA